MRPILFVVAICASALTPMVAAEGQELDAVISIPTTPPSRSAILREVPYRRSESRYIVNALSSRTTTDGAGVSAVKVGAWIGAGGGLVAGVYGGFLLAGSTGCTAEPCHSYRDGMFAIVMTSIVGTGAGAIIGGGVGKLVHVIRSAVLKPAAAATRNGA